MIWILPVKCDNNNDYDTVPCTKYTLFRGGITGGGAAFPFFLFPGVIPKQGTGGGGPDD
jgi:hypothetical protein